MKCKLHSCNNDIPLDRERRNYATCSAKHGKQYSLDKMVVNRARKSGHKVQACSKCNRLFTDHKGEDQEECNKCRGIMLGPRATGRRENYNYDPVGAGVGGKHYKDFRTTVCRRDGLQCANYSECSDSCETHKNGLFKYQANGGVDCHTKVGDIVNRVNYGNSVGLCSVHGN